MKALLDPAVALTDRLVGVMLKLQAAACPIVSVRPATVTVPTRDAPVLTA